MHKTMERIQLRKFVYSCCMILEPLIVRDMINAIVPASLVPK